MRFAAVLVMFALAAAVSLIPPPDALEPGGVPGTEIPPVSICPIVEAGDSHTGISILSSVNGQGRISTFAAGGETGSLDFSTGGSGSVVVPAADIGPVGLAGGLIEMPSETTASGVLITTPVSRAAESCADIPTGQAFLSGGSTASGATFAVQLLNPYAGEASVDLTVTTEAGIESDDRFDAVIVPALSTITLDLTAIIPGREEISVNLETTRGSALAVGRQTTGQDSAIWRAVAPGQDWWLPAPAGGDLKDLVIASPTNDDIEYQVDLYGPEGLLEAHATGVITPRGAVRIPLTSVTIEAVGARVISTGPVVSMLWVESQAGLAATAGSQVDATAWLLPGASSPAGGSGSIVVLNTGLETVTVNVRSLQDTSLSRNFEVAAEDVLVVSLVAADGYRVEATGPIVAMWSSQLGTGSTAAMGIPLQDG